MLTYKDSNGYYEVKGKEVTKEEFEVFTNPLLSKIAELEKQLKDLKKLVV